jgi:hypothetical protein
VNTPTPIMSATASVVAVTLDTVGRSITLAGWTSTSAIFAIVMRNSKQTCVQLILAKLDAFDQRMTSRLTMGRIRLTEVLADRSPSFAKPSISAAVPILPASVLPWAAAISPPRGLL